MAFSLFRVLLTVTTGISLWSGGPDWGKTPRDP